MKVACPHCSVAYTIDDRRVPATGLKVRCPKCRNTFPVRRAEAAPGEGAPVPLPAPAQAAARVAPAPAASPFAQAEAPVPLPAPSARAIAPPPPSAAVPLPSPAAPDPFAFPAADFAAADDPLPTRPEPGGDAQFDDPTAADLPPPAFDGIPLPDLAAPEPTASAPRPPAEPLAFGEVDFADPPPPAAPADRFEEVAPPPPPPPGEELEMLFGEGGGPPRAAAGAAPAGAGGYKVRRRSGKIFGPFDEAQVVEMLSKGELMGNEDVSPDGGATWSAIGAVPAFGEALRKVSAEPSAPAGRREVQRAVPFGDRMAGSKVVEGTGAEEEQDGEAAPRRAWKKLLLPALALLLVAALGAGAGLTSYGFFFVKVFRRGDVAKVPGFLAEARTALARAEYPGDRAALDAASRAVAADADSSDAAALHAIVVAALEVRHGAPAEALEQARRAADRLETDEKGKLPAFAARLAVTLATTPGPATLQQETALEQASAKAPPDAEVFALLARAALERGDAPRAAALYARLETLQPGTPRAGHGAGLALLAGRDVAGAKAAFEKVLQATPGHLPSRLELAAIAEEAGDRVDAEAQLAGLLVDGADQKLAPAERARALALRGNLLSRAASRSAEADQVLDAAVKADPRLVGARLALARHRLRRGDAAGAVTALEPLAAQAAALPAVAAIRIRALAAAGRALDASSLSDQALAKTPGDPALLLAKAAALDASGKADDAALLFRDAAARDPGAYEPRLALGRLALARRDLAQARLDLQAAAEKGPREPAAQAGLGELAAAEGDAAAAERAFQAALSIDPEYAPAEIGLAKLAIAKGDEAAARTRLGRALAIDPRNVEGHLAQGTLLWRVRDLAASEKELQAAVDLQPRNAVALLRLGAVKLERGEDVDGAVTRLTAATNEDPRLAEARQWLGRALLKKGETPSAIAMLRKAVELDPRNPEHHVHLGAALERSGGLAEAVEEYRAAAAADPRSADAHERLGLLFASNGRFEDAAAAFEKAIAAAPKVSRHRVALADCKAKLGRYDDAVRTYREVMKLDPAAVQVLYKVGRAVHESVGAKAALPWYERAAKEEKDNPMPHYYLGYMYKERAQKARAVAEFRRFLQLKPEADEKKDIEAEIEDLSGGVK
ncbi:MAG TPA: tetratricopeptide repeat protein [Anaeromyxobacter sp.]